MNTMAKNHLTGFAEWLAGGLAGRWNVPQVEVVPAGFELASATLMAP